MTALDEHLARYLLLRRGLGYQLLAHGRLLGDLVAYLDVEGIGHLSVDAVLAWSAAASTDGQRARRLSTARRFARYMSAFDPRTEIPPAGLLGGVARRTPYLYSPGQIDALMAQARRLSPPLWASSMTALVGLMAATGIRPGEGRRARTVDLDLDAALLTVADSKNGRSRRLPLHPTTVEALAGHLAVRAEHMGANGGAMFVTGAGAPISTNTLAAAFARLRTDAGIVAPPRRRPPRAYDLRHSFAVATLAGWHADGVDVGPLLPILSAYLGHLRPADTYWYLQAAPELMAVVADRLAAAEALP